MVSMAKMNACMQPLKISKYSDRMAGRPICRKGNYPSTPGSQLSSILLRPFSAVPTRAEMITPESTLP